MLKHIKCGFAFRKNSVDIRLDVLYMQNRNLLSFALYCGGKEN